MQIFTYKDFLKDKGIITFEEAEKIYDALIKSVNIHDPEFLEYWKYLKNYLPSFQLTKVWSNQIIENLN